MTTYIHSFGGVVIETEITPGIGIHLVGLPDNRIRESLLRVATAMQQKGFSVPGKRIKINVTPEVSKDACFLDLPIAIGIISASGQMELPGIDDYIIAGELGLDGSVRYIPGGPSADAAAEQGKKCILPSESVKWLKAMSIGVGVKLYGVDTLDEALSILSGKA